MSQSFLSQQMGAIARDVKHMNVDDSSEIEDIVPQQGPEGLQVEQSNKRLYHSTSSAR